MHHRSNLLFFDRQCRGTPVDGQRRHEALDRHLRRAARGRQRGHAADGIPGGRLTGVHVSRQDITPSRGGRTPGDDVLLKAIQRARSFGVEMKGLHRTGDIARSVCGTAEDVKADLVVIASQDRRPLVARGLVDLDKLLGSSVSDYIRVHAPAPVLLVREPEGRAR